MPNVRSSMPTQWRPTLFDLGAPEPDVSVGERRPFKLRPAGGGPSIGFALGGGDLLVMGGSCQRTWQHSVPKISRAGPRVSITFRHELRSGRPYEKASTRRGDGDRGVEP